MRMDSRNLLASIVLSFFLLLVKTQNNIGISSRSSEGKKPSSALLLFKNFLVISRC
jgi:hypothetical protein